MFYRLCSIPCKQLLQLTIGVIQDRDCNVQETPFDSASTCMLPPLPTMAPMESKKGYLNNTLYNLHYLLFCPLQL